MAQLSRKGLRLLHAITRYVNAEIAESQRDEPTSMGAWYEQVELEEALAELFPEVEDAVDTGTG